MKIEKKIYRLLGKIQHYEWGTKNEKSFIPIFLGIDFEVDLPYAEYWIGIHPKAPSDIIIDDQKYLLNEVIDKFPKEILGERVAKKFNNKLSFLLKLLSINKALSIQAHPNKILAGKLHKIDPNNYPDNNHKPEIAVAIDFLDAIVGIRNLPEIKNSLNEYPEIISLLEKEIMVKIENESKEYQERIIKEIYLQIMNAPFPKIEKCIHDLKNKFIVKKNLKNNEKYFLSQYNNFGIDIGLISILLFNFVSLEKGEAIFTEAGIPHAYLKGNIIECMANSDNVVRGGLTSKFKDIKTLIKMLKIGSDHTFVKKNETEDKIIYKTPAKEFELSRLKLNNTLRINNNDEMSIILILEGEIKIETKNASLIINKGEVYLLPAILNSYNITAVEPSIVYQVNVPK